MEDQKTTFETAKLAKEKGFNEATDTLYVISSGGFVKEQSYGKPYRTDDTTINRPTHSLLQRWLREVHEIEVNVLFKPDSREYKMLIFYWKRGEQITISTTGFKFYEEAFEYGLLEALKLIKTA